MLRYLKLLLSLFRPPSRTVLSHVPIIDVIMDTCPWENAREGTSLLGLSIASDIKRQIRRMESYIVQKCDAYSSLTWRNVSKFQNIEVVFMEYIIARLKGCI